MANVEKALSKVPDLGRFIRDQRKNARLSLRKLSNMAGISNPYLSQIERGLRRPSAEILQAIAKSLRISAETLYVKAGILEERGDEVDPATAILRDLALTDKQKQVLVDIYQSFRHENELAGTGTAGKAAKGRAKAKVAAGATGTRARTAAARKTTAKKTTARKPTARKPTARKGTGTRNTKRTSAARAAPTTRSRATVIRARARVGSKT